MRKLKLQVQSTADGFVAGPQGQLDWMTRAMDDKLLAFITHLTDTSDTILMGRKMTEDFVKYWEAAVKQTESLEFPFAKKMVDYPKIVFSKTMKHIDGKNVRVESGDLVTAVNKLKQASGKDIIVYGGATFVSNLIEKALIDELNLFINPVAIGNGMRIFKDRRQLTLAGSVGYPCGIVVNTYKPK